MMLTRRPGPDRRDGAVQRLLRALDQQPALLVDVTDEERRVGVAVHTVQVRRDVDVDDVAVRQRPIVGDPVADHLVDRRAQRLRVPAIAERRRVRPALDQVLVPDRVQLVGRHTRLRRYTDRLQRLRGQLARHPHLLDQLRRRHVRTVERRRRRLADVFRAGDGSRYVAARRNDASSKNRHGEIILESAAKRLPGGGHPDE
ncbi:hypothetical protein JOF29_007840 [Kribbella aluminosa]|uniref:Uncharacterized protein n=1 Tax=Kribbella aluminosa TaxID=416017 RepID=A0ABS4UYL6_9ACTN|nr:hypothetical protein [Kribbella aluminosa]